MEIQFKQSNLSCLRWDIHTVCNQELTQDIRLSEDQPDVGRILGVWGQALLRSKEWVSSGVGVSGGVMVWVLYTPEDGSAPRVIESWLPFQCRLNLSEPDTNGKLLCKCCLQSMDARSASARKVIVRGCIGIQCEALTQQEIKLYTPVDLPEDVQVLRQTYPISLPTEAGEKMFTLDEELSLPSTCPKIAEVVRYELRSEIIDQKILSGKLVFRGVGILHLLYITEDGRMASWDFDVPFSQYTELDREYSETADVSVFCENTNLELDIDSEDLIRLRAGLTGQYTVFDRFLTEIVTDAYSPLRDLTPEWKQIVVPAVLERTKNILTVEHILPIESDKIVDVAYFTDCPNIRRTDLGFIAEIPGSFLVLYYDSEGKLQSAAAKTTEEYELSADLKTTLHAMCFPSGKPQISQSDSSIAMRMDCRLQTVAVSANGTDVVVGMVVGDAREPDPTRPSLFIRKVGEDTFWEIAKSFHSTVDTIKVANHLDTEPSPDAMLLIPVI